jgi:hypothetical protein
LCHGGGHQRRGVGRDVGREHPWRSTLPNKSAVSGM